MTTKPPESTLMPSNLMPSKKLGFLGGGQMATALAKGALASELTPASDLIFCEPSAAQQWKLAEAFPGCTIVSSGSDLFPVCDRIILSVKPQILREIAGSLKKLVNGNHCLISIAAGISLPQLSEWFGTHAIIRVMPNTPAQVLAGASGMTCGRDVSDADRNWSEQFLKSVGSVVHVSDSLLHAVTGLSGSGPAYVLLIIEAMADGGVAAGLSREVATQLAVQTVLGTAKMVQETGQHPAILKDQVTSPAGTTIAGLAVLEQRGVRSAMIDAILAATTRSKALG
jgi:pyrroline-5-carboxylate reductase